MIKAIDHACLSVSDINRSLAFYRDILGLKLQFQEETKGEQFGRLFGVPTGFHAKVAQFEEGLEISQFLSPEGRKLGIQTWDIGAMFVIFRVSNLDKLYANLKAKGVKFANPPTTLKSPHPGGGALKIAHFHGPDGERISLMEYVDT